LSAASFIVIFWCSSCDVTAQVVQIILLQLHLNFKSSLEWVRHVKWSWRGIMQWLWSIFCVLCNSLHLTHKAALQFLQKNGGGPVSSQLLQVLTCPADSRYPSSISMAILPLISAHVTAASFKGSLFCAYQAQK
jgi:hypothetical protein